MEFAFEVVERIGVLVHGAQQPTDAQWEQWIGALQKHRVHKCLVLTKGGGPSSKQRAAVRTVMEPSMRSAVVTASTLARGAVTAFKWFGVDIQAFSPQELPDAIRFLEAEPWASELQAAAQRLEAKVA